MELRKITDEDLQGVGVVGMEDTPNLSAYEMQLKVEEVVREVVIPVINANVDNTVSKKELSETVFNSGAGDMQAAAYDADLDGTVNSADNGFFVYTHSGNNLTGKGDNGKFKASVAGTYSIFNVNGSDRYVKCGEESEIELVANAWYTFILDGNTINFKQGGAGLNFKIVGGTTQPASPKENTIWVNTDVAIGHWQFAGAEPETRTDGTALQAGDVWLKTGVNSSAKFNAIKKNAIEICILGTYQWNDSSWAIKTPEIYTNGEWNSLSSVLLGGGANLLGTPTFNILGGSTGAGNIMLKENGNYNIVLTAGNTWCNMDCRFPNRITNNGFSTLKVTFICTNIKYSDYGGGTISLAIETGNSWDGVNNDALIKMFTGGQIELNTKHTVLLDISSVSQFYTRFYISLSANDNFTFEVEELSMY